MRFLKKCLALLLVYAMVSTISLSAFAESADSTSLGSESTEVVEETVELVDKEEGSEELENEEELAEEELAEEDSTEEDSSDENDSIDQEDLQDEEELESEEENKGSETSAEENSIVRYNLGKREVRVAPADYMEETDDYFDEEGNYSIWLGEDPFFPYEVQFSYNDTVETKWFMTPQDQVEVNGHIFTVDAYFTGEVMTQMSFNVGGKIVTVYPEAKTFVNEAPRPMLMRAILQPSKTTDKSLTVDFSSFFLPELTGVAIEKIFYGGNALAATDKLAWRYDSSSDNAEFIVSPVNARLNLLYGISDYNSSTYWEMVVCKGDQLDPDNVHYNIRLNLPSADSLLPEYRVKNSSNLLENSSVSEGHAYTSKTGYGYDTIDYHIYGYCNNPNYTGNNGVIKFNYSGQSDTTLAYMRIYEGKAYDLSGIVGARDITSEIWGNDADGYQMSSNSAWITFVIREYPDAAPTGFMPMNVSIYAKSSNTSTSDLYLSFDRVYATDSSGQGVDIQQTYNIIHYDEYDEIVAVLYQGFKANASYLGQIGVYSPNGDPIKIYLGKHASKAEAVANNATDLTDIIDSAIGYVADYSQGVQITVFAGDVPHYYLLKVEEGNRVQNELSDATTVSFRGLKDKNGNAITPVYIVTRSYDSLGNNNYPIMLVGKDVDLKEVAPVFTTATGIKLYASGQSTAEVSGVSKHDFSGGKTVQYTASAENKEVAKNYWLTILNAQDGAGKLVVTGENDENSNLEVKDGVTYLEREILLDSYHDNMHDVFVANMGMSTIPNLKVEVSSDQLELDSFWTLNGTSDLPGYDAVVAGGYASNYSDNDALQLPNIARVRLRMKNGVANKSEIAGTLTFKSGSTVLMEMKLTGIIGNPFITTQDIPQAVKYVPYGTMIQNNNKYDWNSPKYSLFSGSLPTGMEIEPDGELCGVPKTVGTFNFTIKMENSSYTLDTDYKTFSLVVSDNTDENVDGATDGGATVSKRLEDIILSSVSGNSLTTDLDAEQKFISQGDDSELKNVYLDGELLSPSQYVVEHGSTIITVSNQTLANVADTPDGRHTFALEYRNEDDVLYRAAQNYYIKKDLQDNPKPGNSKSKKDGGDDDDGGFLQTIWNTLTGKNKAQPAAETEISYTVQSGDTLSKIAAKYLGSANNWRQIFEDNKATIKDPNKIYVGQVIVIKIKQTGTVSEGADGTRTYTVVPKDTLWKIAKKVYGSGWRWKKIYDANTATISHPNKIRVGQVLVIPD